MSDLKMLPTNNLEWMIEILIILGVATILAFVLSQLFNIFAKKDEQSRLSRITLNSARAPLKFFLWIIALTVCAKLIAAHFDYDIKNDISSIKNLGIIFALSWFFWNAVNEYGHQLKHEGDEFSGKVSVSFIMKILKICIVIIALLMAIQTLGINITGLVAFGGIGGVIFGFAGKDLLANFLGSLMIYFDRPFEEGDWIRSPDREIEGVVEHVGWRLTQVRNFDKRMLYIPNSIFPTIIVENPSRMTNRHIRETIRLRYEDISKLKRIMDEIKNYLSRSKDLDQKLGAVVNLDKFDNMSINFFIDAYTITKSWVEFNEVKQSILLRVSEIISKNDARIALNYPLLKNE